MFCRAWFRALVIFFTFTFACAPCAFAQITPDYAREQRWAEEIVPGLVVGDAIQLETEAKRRFLAIHAPGKPGGGAVLLSHGSGVHPDFGVIGQLRTLLNDAGYSTLSLQMPVLAAEATANDYPAVFPEAGERIAAGIAYLRNARHARIALVTHSMGARMAREYLKRNPATQLAVWVPLAIVDGDLAGLPKFGFPVLDIYAEKDFEVILAKTDERARALSAQPRSRQIMMPGADHFFTGRERELDRLLRDAIAPLMRD